MTVRADLILDGDRLVVKHTQNIQPILEANRVLYDNYDGYNREKDMKHVARIPELLIIEWANQGINFYEPEGRERIMKMLNQPEYQYLRTSKGEI